MANHDISILGWNQAVASTGNVFYEIYAIKATNDVFPQHVLIFNDTATKDGVFGAFPLPQNYVGSPSVVIVWTSTATTGNVVWDFDYRAVGGNDAESLDQATYQESVTVTDAAPGAANRRLEVTIALTAGNFAAGDTVEFALSRDGTDGADTMTAAAILHDVLLRYADA